MFNKKNIETNELNSLYLYVKFFLQRFFLFRAITIFGIKLNNIIELDRFLITILSVKKIEFFSMKELL